MATCASCGTDLPAEARFCPGCGAPVEPAAPAADERKLATVLFADLVGSTELGEQDPERTRALLDRFYDAMAAEIEGAGGTVEKFAGDAVMAAFGAPAAQEDHAERALHAALSMQRKLEELFGGELALRIGVNTGDVVVGRPREGSSFVTGDAVNVAARLEQAAAPGEILAGERTVAIARGAFEFDGPSTVEAKGKPDGVSCRRVVRALTLMRPRGVGGLHRAFVGRDRELDLLQATYHRVAEQGEPHLVTIMGDAGVGKTRIVRELWSWLADKEPEPLRRTGRCLSYGRAITYWPLGEILKEHLGILDSDPPETALRRLEGREILALALGLDVAGDLHPLTVREQLHEAWVGFLGSLAAERPVVLLIEDLHWAEEELLDLIERLLRDVRRPVFLLATSRPELLDSRPAWGGGKRNSSLLWVDPLSANDSERMVAELLAADLPDQLRVALVDRAGGNPFFVEELVRTLIDRGIIHQSDGGWAAADFPADLEIPDSVQAVLSARMDLLPPAEKAALQAASVIGRSFWDGPVRELLGEGEPDFALLEDRDFVRRRTASSMAGEREYVIKHALTREVAYSTVPKARRARLHAAFAEWIERSRESREEHASLLGHHYAEAVRPEDADLAWGGEEDELERLRGKAVEWLRRAGELATARYELDDAIALFRRALELENDRPALARLWYLLGRAHAFKFDGRAFWAAMEKAIELCDDDSFRADLYAELAYQSASRVGMWPVLPEWELLEGWIDQALELAEPESATTAKALAARSMWNRGRGGDTGHSAAVQASELADRLGDPELRATARVCRVFASFVAGDYAEAQAWAERSYELIDEVKDPDVVTDILGVGTLPAIALGRFPEARRMALLYDDASSKLTRHHRVHGVAMLAEVEELAGNWPAIGGLEARTREVVAANLATPCIRNARTLLLCAIAAEYGGDRDRARELEESASELRMEKYGTVLGAPEMRLAIARGDLQQLEEVIDVDWRVSTWFGMSAIVNRMDGLAALGDRKRLEEEAPPLMKPHTYPEPFALRALGIVREDDELIRQALEGFEAMGLDWHAEHTRALLTPA
jgi:class 3 adenylate cyclase/tetratricopeptide (TPR) repeat protein